MALEWPAYGLGPMRVTRMACPEGPAEDAFLSALATMTAAGTAKGKPVLTDPQGRAMVFAPVQP